MGSLEGCEENFSWQLLCTVGVEIVCLWPSVIVSKACLHIYQGENEDSSFTEIQWLYWHVYTEVFLKFPVPAMLQYDPQEQSRRFWLHVTENGDYPTIGKDQSIVGLIYLI